MRFPLVIVLLGALAGAGRPVSAAASPSIPQELTPLMQHAPITLQSGPLRMRFFPASAWTFKEIAFDDQILTQFNSHTSLVINLGGSRGWVGTGHRERGTEQVHAIQLLVDGREVDPLKGGSFQGETIELIKESTLATLALKTIFRLHRGTLETEQFLQAQEDIQVSLIYAFMYPWKADTSQWRAEGVSGQQLAGKFEDSRDWELREDVRWAAIFHPRERLAALTQFAVGSQRGVGVKHGFWNVKGRYHKQYYQPIADEEIKAGTRYHWQSRVLFVPTNEATWSEAIRSAEQRAPFSLAVP